MTTRPQVLTLTAGATSVTLDTRTVARALKGATAHPLTGAEERKALRLVADTLRDLCGPDHLAAVLRDDGAPTTNDDPTTTED